MNICLVSQQYPPDTVRGGIGIQTWNKARSLAALGHTVHVVASALVGHASRSAQGQDGVTVHRLSPPGAEFPVYETATFWMGYTWLVLRQLQQLRSKIHFDVIDFPEYGAEGFAYQLDRTPWNWTPVVVQLHAPLALLAEHLGWPGKDTNLYQVGTFMEGFSIARADALMACSANIADFAAARYEIPRGLIAVVHCGVDAEVFQPVPAERVTSGRPTVLFVGNLAANKGLDTVLEAMLRLRRKYPDIRLQILGRGDDSFVDKVKARSHAEGAQANVEWCGFVHRDRIVEYYQRADAFCSPATHEGGVANVYLEAMACGCPVIASTAGGAPEAIQHEETGLLVPPSDVDAVVVALDRVLGSAAFRRSLGTKARKRVEDHFAMDRYIRRVLASYERAIERAGTSTERRRIGDTGR